MKQIARNVTMEGSGILRDCRYLLHDRDTKYTQSFRAIIASGQVEPLALPAREFMERAQTIWQELDLPALTPQPPWHGYSLGDWSQNWSAYAERAVAGKWEQTGQETFARRRGGLIPETPVREVEAKDSMD